MCPFFFASNMHYIHLWDWYIPIHKLMQLAHSGSQPFIYGNNFVGPTGIYIQTDAASPTLVLSPSFMVIISSQVCCLQKSPAHLYYAYIHHSS